MKSAAHQILEILEAQGNFTESPPATGPFPPIPINAVRLTHTERFVRANEPVEMVILGFPAKSPNRRKTFSDHVDRGEIEALSQLQRLCEKIREVYTPGARLTICSDGHIFADLVHVTDENIDQFQTEVDEAIVRFGFSYLRTFHLRDYYPGVEGDRLRKQICSEYAPSELETRQLCSRDFEGRNLYNGIHRFLFEDDIERLPHLSRNQVRRSAGARTYEVIRRSQAFSRLVECHFPGALRLSIHPQPFNSNKLGIQLVPGQSRWATPWHNVLVLTDRGPTLLPRHTAETEGAQLSFFADKYAFFEMRK